MKSSKEYLERYGQHREERYKYVHLCPEAWRDIVFDRVRWEWLLISDEYEIPIKFCPFCGAELGVPPGATKMAPWDYEDH